jgi:rhodanese-related sulfurtransferase
MKMLCDSFCFCINSKRLWLALSGTIIPYGYKFSYKFTFKLSLAVTLAAFLLLTAGSCEDKQPLDDHAKLEKIDQLYQKYKRSFSEVPDITATELLSLKTQQKVVLVDVRPPKERNVSIIPQALTAAEFESQIEKYQDFTVVAYCTIGQRSGLYVKNLRNKKFDAYNLKGSVLAWAHAGQKFVNETGETNKVHVYGPKWDLLPEKYEGTW